MPRAEHKNRYLLAAAVAALHVGLVVVFIETQAQAIHPYAETAAALMVFLSMTRRRAPFPRPAPLPHAALTVPIHARIGRPGAITAPGALRIEVPHAIDWMAASRQAAAAILARKAKQAFAFPAGAAPFRALKGSSQNSPPHAGESYRTHAGRQVQWISKHCYFVSNPPRPGESQLHRQTRMSRFSCKGLGGSSASERFIKRMREYARRLRGRSRERERIARGRLGP